MFISTDTNNTQYSTFYPSHTDIIEDQKCSESINFDMKTNQFLDKKTQLQAENIKLLYENIVVECVSKQFDFSTEEDPFQSEIYKTVTSRLNNVLDRASEYVNQKHPNILKGDAFYRFIKNGFLQVAEEITTSATIQKIPNLPVKGHFYKIEDSEGRIRGYLLGTVHVIDKSIMDMNKKINKAIDKADHLFLEIKDDLALMVQEKDPLIDKCLKMQSEEELKKMLQSYMNILAFHPLKNTLWPELEQEIVQLNIIDALHLCLKYYHYVSACETGTLDSSNSIIFGIDGYLRQQFVKTNKPIFGLETNESASKIISETYPDDLNFFEELFQGMCDPKVELNKKMALEISNQWSRGGIEARSNQEGTKEYKLLEERSIKFEEVIYQDILLNKVGFYGFGVNHLYDSRGVIKGLQKRNLKVIRI